MIIWEVVGYVVVLATALVSLVAQVLHDRQERIYREEREARDAERDAAVKAALEEHQRAATEALEEQTHTLIAATLKTRRVAMKGHEAAKAAFREANHVNAKLLALGVTADMAETIHAELERERVEDGADPASSPPRLQEHQEDEEGEDAD